MAVDAVLIGRNEGARLVNCLSAVKGQVRRIVYVDSGSTDGSVAVAHAAGAEVVVLNMDRPFTAARARNAGLAQVRGADTPADFIQFLDGDTVMDAGWLRTALGVLTARPELALVCGRRRERFPAASLYNLLCDLEWDTPVGETRASGGDALVRRAAIEGIGGYRDDVIAAEDDEMCQRLRAAGWRLERIDAEMTLHDAAITRFAQWWRRAVRAGHGFAQVGGLHPGHFRAERRRVWLWGVVLPLIALAGLLAAAPWVAVGIALLYLASFGRVALRYRRQGLGWRAALGCAGLISLSKFSNLQGVLTYRLRRLRGDAARIIEYK